METNTHYTGNGRLGPAALSFTYIIGAVAPERGVTDDKRTGSDVDGTAVLKREVNSSNWHRITYMQHREPVNSERILGNRKTPLTEPPTLLTVLP